MDKCSYFIAGFIIFGELLRSAILVYSFVLLTFFHFISLSMSRGQLRFIFIHRRCRHQAS